MRARGRASAAALLLVLVAACRGGDGPPPARVSNTSPPPSGATTATTAPTAPSPTAAAGRTAPPPGSVTFSAFDVPLTDTGLRVVARTSSSTARVVVRGAPTGSNSVEVCAVGDSAAAARADRCTVASGESPVEVRVSGGVAAVLVRAAGAGSNNPSRTLAEVALTYPPADAAVTALTVVAPPLPAPAAMSFRLAPTGSGRFELSTDGRGGRPHLTLEAGPAGGRPSRVVATVEGGSRLSIRSTVDGPPDATLTYRNLGPGALPPLELALAWPWRA